MLVLLTLIMQLLVYLLLYPLILLISWMPFCLLYYISDIMFILVYYIIRYRVNTVRENLSLCFPAMEKAELLSIEKKFYRHFCDNFLEMIKTLNISRSDMRRRFVFTNFEMIENLEQESKSVVLLIGHYASYEWLLSMHLNLKRSTGYGIYKPIKNRYFDKLVRKMRSRFNAHLVGIREIITLMRSNKKTGSLSFYGFIIDQSPKLSAAIHWGVFFDMKVPIHVGGELLAKRMGLTICFVQISKLKRGHYTCTFLEVKEDLQKVPDFEITDRFMKMLEEQIKSQPEYYLWTHKRFKHKIKGEY